MARARGPSRRLPRSFVIVSIDLRKVSIDLRKVDDVRHCICLRRSIALVTALLQTSLHWSGVSTAEGGPDVIVICAEAYPAVSSNAVALALKALKPG